MMGKETFSLNELRKNMGVDSNRIIDNIITFSQKAGLELNKITDSVSAHILSFLEQKREISQEYPEGTPTGDDYRYENRLKYRANIRGVIKDVLSQTEEKMTSISDEALITLKKELENELHNPRP